MIAESMVSLGVRANLGAERRRAHCIIGDPPVFPICANGDDQKLESQTLLSGGRTADAERHATNTAAQARRLSTFRSASRRAP